MAEARYLRYVIGSPMHLFPRLLLLAFLTPAFIALHADTPGVAMQGNARFTVITPNLIRMEYAPDAKFVDLPSWFAVERKTRDTDAKITMQNGKVDIDTGAIHLTYQENGKPFSPDNLQAEIKKGSETVTWKPGMQTKQNLGGTIRTLDQAKGPENLGDGILARDGWYLLDDSKSALFSGDWIQPRPKNNGTDWYLFGYGLDFRAAFKSLTAAGGAFPLPRKYTLGIWYSRYWPYSADEFKQIVQEYEQHGFPLDTIVMDMDWHLNKSPVPNVDTWTGYTWDRALIPDPVALLKWFHDQGLHVTLNDHPAPRGDVRRLHEGDGQGSRFGPDSLRCRRQALPRYLVPVFPPAARKGRRRFLVARLAAISEHGQPARSDQPAGAQFLQLHPRRSERPARPIVQPLGGLGRSSLSHRIFRRRRHGLEDARLRSALHQHGR
jgi:hypothetical protein